MKNWKFQKRTKNHKNIQVDSRINNTKTKTNNLTHSFNSRLDPSKERITDLEYRWKDPE